MTYVWFLVGIAAAALVFYAIVMLLKILHLTNERFDITNDTLRSIHARLRELEERLRKLEGR